MRTCAVIFLCVSITVSCFVGSAPLIGDRIDNTGSAQLDNNVVSRVNFPQYANSYLQYQQTNQHNPYLMKPGYYPPNRYGFEQNQGVMDVLESIAARDERHCVSKLLCEMTSSGKRDGYNHQKPSSILNLDTLATLLAGVDDSLASPLVKFSKALILGYTAKHNTQCQYAYPQCPNDPEQLVHYLNNQNGGLFSLFNNPSKPLNRFIQPWRLRSQDANSFYIYDYSTRGDKRQYAWQFPSYDSSQIHNYGNDGRVVHYERGKSLKFPNEHKEERNYIQNVNFLFPDNRLGNDKKHNRDFFPE